MKIIYFIDRISSSTGGGMERILTAKVNMLSERGHQVGIITIEDGKQAPYYPLNKNVKVFYLDIEKRLLEIMKRKKSLSKLQKIKSLFKKSYDPQYAQKVIEILNQEKPDICIGCLMKSEFDILPLHKLKDGSKKILEFHNSKQGILHLTRTAKFPKLTQWYFKNIKLKEYEKIIKKYYNAFVVLTHKDRKDWKNLKNITIIPNFTTMAQDNRFPDYNQKIILSVGRMDYQKGFDLLIKAWTILEHKYPDWQLRIIGKAKDTSNHPSDLAYHQLASYLDKVIHKNKLKNIKILPAVKNIEEEYYKSSIYTGASRFEGFGLVFLEAMSCGLPCVSFDTPCGPSEIITDKEDGYIAEYLNIEDLANKLSLLMDDQDKREKMGKKAKVNIKRFSPDKIITQWEKLFNQIVK